MIVIKPNGRVRITFSLQSTAGVWKRHRHHHGELLRHKHLMRLESNLAAGTDLWVEADRGRPTSGTDFWQPNTPSAARNSSGQSSMITQNCRLDFS